MATVEVEPTKPKFLHRMKLCLITFSDSDAMLSLTATFLFVALLHQASPMSTRPL